jgi:hypothetical protein
MRPFSGRDALNLTVASSLPWKDGVEGEIEMGVAGMGLGGGRMPGQIKATQENKVGLHRLLCWCRACG